jgi:LTXXQ motif family protein
VQANDQQRSALERVRSTANDAAETLSAACPKDTPAELGQRLEQLGRAFDTIAASLATLRPALAAFYDTLDDEQKARLVAIDFSRKSVTKPNRNEPERANGRASNGSDPAHDPVCNRWVAILRKWSIRQVESGISLSDEQHAIL